MLIGKLVKLRLVEEQDLPLLMAWRNAPVIWSSFFNKFPLSMAGQKTWFANLISDHNKELFMICTLANSQPIGTVGLDHIDFPNQSVEFGNILIGEQEYIGKGYGAEATKLMLAYCFLRLNMNRIYLEVYADNDRAIRLYKRAGFKVDGILRESHFENGGFKDTLIMSMLRKEFLGD